MPTHQVFNQPPPLQNYDLFGEDRALEAGVRREGAAWALEELHALGLRAGQPDVITWGVEANAHPPLLRTHDRYGNRIDRVDYHPSYHRLMREAVAAGLHCTPWTDERSGAHLARAAAFYLWSQVDAGHGCPISMTYSALPALSASTGLLQEWSPRLTSRVYDPEFAPAAEKRGSLAGMAMTEKQGGSDVRANTTVAEPEGSDGAYRLTGHKWFCSAPMSDVFLMLAQAPGGLSCFAVPRFAPDRFPNAIRVQRLKEKLGNRSNASSEIELERVWAQILGEEGRGVRTIIEMVNHTRLDCVTGAASGMRQAVAQATHHAAHRRAFGAELVDQPLMQNVLADLAVESEAATLTMLRLAGAYDRAGSDAHEAALRRVATAVCKYWVCKRHVAVAAEALECLGGNGYVEESLMPRLFRESPLNGIWEGSGNVICLDVLRAMAREPATMDAFLTECRLAGGVDRRFDASLSQLEKLEAELLDTNGLESGARRVVERLALVFQGALLLRHGDAAVADAFCASRLGGDWGRALGTLPPGVDFKAVIDRARPQVA